MRHRKDEMNLNGNSNISQNTKYKQQTTGTTHKKTQTQTNNNHKRNLSPSDSFYRKKNDLYEVVSFVIHHSVRCINPIFFLAVLFPFCVYIHWFDLLSFLFVCEMCKYISYYSCFVVFAFGKSTVRILQYTHKHTK